MYMVEHDVKRGVQEDISRYKAILDKDPSSTIFAALAESLRRLGQFDEAIKISLEGLKIHPRHISARVALAKAYYDKGLLKEAGRELEEVIKAAPDNILAQRLLKDVEVKVGTQGTGVTISAVSPPVLARALGKESRSEHRQEAVGEGERGEKGLAGSDTFYTLTMAGILEKQGFKQDAMRIYQFLLKKGRQNDHVIREKMERLRNVR